MGLTHLSQRQHPGDEGTQLAPLDQRSQLLESRPLAREEHTVEGLVLLVERRQVALRAEDGRQAPE